jgi:hypothetical protein
MKPGKPLLEYAFSISLDLDHIKGRLETPVMVSGNKYGQVTVAGGLISGPRLSGKVLPGGGDFPTVGQDGYPHFDARYVLQADDGTLIRFRNRGLREPARFTSAAALDREEIYFRTTPTIDVCPGPHEWLTRSVFVGFGHRISTGNRIDYYELHESNE